jgi:branched-chain amino acid transport system substrate-binding protein
MSNVAGQTVGRLRWFAVLLVMVVLAGACGSDDKKPAASTDTGGTDKAAKGTPIKVGVVLDKSGNFANFGIGEEVAAKLAVEEINAAGGAGGRPIELIVKDSGSAPDQAISVTRELIERDQVVAILGPGLTTTAEAGFPIANQSKVPTISPTIVSPTAAPNNRPWTFSIGAPADYLFEANFPGIKAKYPNVKRVAVVIDPECAGCKSEATTIANFMANNGYTVVNKDNPIALQAGAPDVGAQATAVANLKPDAVAGSAGPNEWARLSKELERRSLKIPAFSGTGPNNPAFLQQAGTSAEGWTVLSAFWEQNPDATVQKFVSTIKPRLKTAGRPEGSLIGADAQYYDAAKILAKIITEAKLAANATVDVQREAIRKGVQGLTDFTGVTGKMAMQANGRMKVTGYMLIVQGGAFTRLGA